MNFSAPISQQINYSTDGSRCWKNGFLLTLNLSCTTFHNSKELIDLLSDVYFDDLTSLDVGNIHVVVCVAQFVVVRFLQLTTIKFKGKRRDKLFCEFLNSFQCVELRYLATNERRSLRGSLA